MPSERERNVHELRVTHGTGPGGKLIAYTIVRPGDAVDMTISHPFSEDHLRACQEKLRETATRLDGFSGNVAAGGGGHTTAGDFSFAELGNALAAYLPAELVDRFLATSDAPLTITTDDPAFPWHLVSVGGEFLGMRRPLGVRLALRYDEVRASARIHDGPRTALLIADPSSTHQRAWEEAEQVRKLLLQADPELLVTPLYKDAANLGNVHLKLSQNFDHIHYAGHVRFDTAHGGRREMVLAFDEHLSLHGIRHYPHTASFVFMNGCWAGATTLTISPDAQGRIFPEGTLDGFGIEFLRGGARAFIAPLWPVFDGLAKQFACRLYEHAITGMPLGKALYHTRQEARRERPWDPTWACYLLFGSPAETLFARPPAGNGAAQETRGTQATQATWGNGSRKSVSPPRSDGARDDPGLPRGTAEPSAEQIATWLRRGRRQEKVLRQGDKHLQGVQLADDAALALGLMVDTVYLTDGRKVIHGIDLALALCRLPADSELRALLAAHFPVEEIAQWASDMFKRDEERRAVRDHLRSTQVDDALAKADEIARGQGRTVVTALDLARAVLSEPEKSVRDMYESLVSHVSVEEVRKALEALAETRRMRTVAHMVSTEIHSIENIRLGPVVRTYGVDLLQAARNDDLRYVWGWSELAHNERFAPSAAWARRKTTLTSLANALRRAPAGHVLVYGAPGAGKWALIEALAYALASGQGGVGLPELAEWGFWGLPKADLSAATDVAAVREELTRRIELFLAEANSVKNMIAAIEDLPRYLPEDAAGQKRLRKQLAYYLTSGRLRLIVTASDRQLLNQFFGGTNPFAPIEVRVELPDEIRQVVAGYAKQMEREYRVVIADEAVRAACAETSLPALAQPGLGIRVLRKASESVRGHDAGGRAGGDEVEEITGLIPATHETIRDARSLEQVSAEQVRLAAREVRAALNTPRQG